MITNSLEKTFSLFNALTEQEQQQLVHINCCEHIVIAGDLSLKMLMPKDVYKIARGFGGGMKIENTCGALTGSVMVLSHLFYDDENLGEIIQTFFKTFSEVDTNYDCKTLKENYREEDTGCQEVMLMASRALDTVLNRFIERG